MRLNVLYSMLGVVFNTIFPIIVFPYISRVLGVEMLGKYNYYNSMITYIALISNFGIGVYGVREIGRLKNDIVGRSQAAVELITLNILFVSLCYLFLFFLVFFGGYKEDANIILIFSVILLTNAIGAEWFFVGMEKQQYLLLRNILLKIVSLALIFIFVRNSKDLLKYVLVTTFSLSAVSLINVFYLRKYIDLKKTVSPKLKKYLLPLFLIFIVEIEVRYFGLGDVVILGNISDNEAVGFYSMGLKIFMLLSSVLKIATIAMLPRASYYINQGETNKFNAFICNTINMIFFIGLPCSIIMYVWAEPIVLFLGGMDFLPSVPLLQKFSFLLILSVLVNAFVFQVLYPQNKIRSIILIYWLSVVINILANNILVSSFSYAGTFYSSLLSHIFIFSCFLIFEKKAFPLSFFSKNLLKYVYSGIIFIIVVVLLDFIPISINFIIEILICSSIYVLTLVLQRDVLIYGILNQLKKKYGKKKY